MKQSTEDKLAAIVNGFLNGAKKETAKKVKSITKLELALLLTCLHEVECDVVLSRVNKIDLEDFVLDSLEGMYA